MSATRSCGYTLSYIGVPRLGEISTSEMLRLSRALIGPFQKKPEREQIGTIEAQKERGSARKLEAT